MVGSDPRRSRVNSTGKILLFAGPLNVLRFGSNCTICARYVTPMESGEPYRSKFGALLFFTSFLGHPNTYMHFWKHITTVNLTSELSVGVKFPHTFSHVDAIPAAAQTEQTRGAPPHPLIPVPTVPVPSQPGPGAS